MAERYNFKYLPLVGKLPGKSMVEQTESAINELASVVYDNVGYVGNLAEEVQTANTNASNALEKATEALETSGRVYIKLIAAVDVNDYYDSELYYINNDGSTNIPVRDRGFLEVKTNDDKTACEQVFIADSTGTPYYRHGVITEQTLGEETTYVVTWSSWYQGATTEYVQGVKAEANAYTDEQIRQHGNVPVGFEYFSMNPNVPQGSLPLLGGEYNRSTYSDLWAWVQQQTGYLKTESEWQALSTANNGNVPYYSNGDGSTTFRVPSLKCWIKGANGTVTEVGSYLEAGLPNIIAGKLTTQDWGDIKTQMTGAWNQTSHGVKTANVSGGTSADEFMFTFDASRSNSIYGNSTTVQPESIVGMWLVKAYGTIEDTGTIDEQQYIDDRIAALPTSLASTFLPLAGGEMSGDISFPTQVWDDDYVTSYQTAKTLTSRYGIKGHMPTDRHVFYTLAMARDDSNKPSSDETCRFATLEAAVGDNANPHVYLRMYKNEENSTSWSQLQMYWDSNDKARLLFDSREVDRINSSGSNYIRYENGLQICWGKTSNLSSANADTYTDITLPASFINTDYSVSLTTCNVSGGWNNHSFAIANKTTTSMRAQLRNLNSTAYVCYFMWIAVGYWK